MSIQAYTASVPGKRSFFYIISLDKTGAERGGEIISIEFHPNGKYNKHGYSSLSFKLPENLFSDQMLVQQMEELAQNRLYVEYGSEVSHLERLKLQSSSIPALIVRMMISDQLGTLIQVVDDSTSESLEVEMNKFKSLKDISIKIDK